MQNPSRMPILLWLLLLAACGEDQPPTAPGPGAGPVGPAGTQSAVLRVVNSLADPGDGTCNARQCTLREAIKDPQSTQISFASGLSGAITLATSGAGGGSLLIDKALTITGPTAGITIQRRSTDPRFRILRIGTAGNVALTNLILRNGRADPGGGILNFGTLALTNCTVTANMTGGHGGGIDNHGPLTLTRTTVSSNAAPAGGGGGIDNHKMPITARSSSIVQNSGGGLVNGGGRLDFANTGISNNSGRGLSQDWGRATLDHVRIAGNSGGGMSQHQSRTTLTNSTVVLNTSGGGLSNSAGGSYTVVNSTITGNSASGRGGGIYNTSGDPFGRLSASVLLINSTVSGNSADVGGGIENEDRLGGAGVTAINSTIARNTARIEGGGVHNGQSGDPDNPNSIFLSNSLVALNTAPTAPDAANVGGRFSLIGDGSGSGLSSTNGNQVGTHSSPIDPKIGPLANNGGPTRTHALLAGSPAIDAAESANCPPTDQRGVARPQGAGCDIGSYEK